MRLWWAATSLPVCSLQLRRGAGERRCSAAPLCVKPAAGRTAGEAEAAGDAAAPQRHHWTVER